LYSLNLETLYHGHLKRDSILDWLKINIRESSRGEVFLLIHLRYDTAIMAHLM